MHLRDRPFVPTLPLRSIVRESQQGEGRRIFSPEGLGNASGNALRRVPIWALKAAARLVELSSVAVRRTKYKPNKPNNTLGLGLERELGG